MDVLASYSLAKPARGIDMSWSLSNSGAGNDGPNQSDRCVGAALVRSCWTFKPEIAAAKPASLSQDDCSLPSDFHPPRLFGIASSNFSSISSGYALETARPRVNSSSSSISSGYALEAYSRKVFVGGLPLMSEAQIKDHFIRFGQLTVEWPHKAESKADFPPNGFAFVVFEEEVAVHQLIKSCLVEEGKLFMFVSSDPHYYIKVQIRPWNLSDSDYTMDHTKPIHPRKTIFVGGVPRQWKAFELAEIFNSRYGNVCHASIDCYPDINYPKGAGQVTFSSIVSYRAAVDPQHRFFQAPCRDTSKLLEVEPFVYVDQMCDECEGMHCSGYSAPYFCRSTHCLRYYCDHCWAEVHSAPATMTHCRIQVRNLAKNLHNQTPPQNLHNQTPPQNLHNQRL